MYQHDTKTDGNSIMTTKNEEQVALALLKKDIAIVKISNLDYDKISKIHDEMYATFIDKCKSLGIPVRRGRSNNLPTITHAVNFLLSQTDFTSKDLDNYIEKLAMEESQ